MLELAALMANGIKCNAMAIKNYMQQLKEILLMALMAFSGLAAQQHIFDHLALFLVIWSARTGALGRSG
jgi:hypothetical protein